VNSAASDEIVAIARTVVKRWRLRLGFRAVDVRGLDFDAIVAIGDLAKVSTLL